MAVISGLFRKIAARIEDPAQAQKLIETGLKADPSKAANAERQASLAGLDAKDAAEVLLDGMIDEVRHINDALRKLRVPLTLTYDMEAEPREGDSWWNDRIKGVTIELFQEQKRLMLFKATRSDAGGYYIEAEDKLGSDTMILDMQVRKPVADFAEAEQELAAHIDTGFNIRKSSAAAELDALIKALDPRPLAFIEIAKTRPFDEVLAAINDGLDVSHAYADYEGRFKPVDFIFLPERFTQAQQRELVEAIVAQAEDPKKIFSRQTMIQAVIHNSTELITRLVELGGVVQPGHFRDANTFAMLKTLRPYIDAERDRPYITEAAHNAAYHGDLERFKWLDTLGIDRNSQQSHNFPTYAHGVAHASDRKKTIATGGKDVWPAFLGYLIDSGYPLDVGGQAGTPVEVATENGNPDLARTLIDAGAKVTPALLQKAISGAYFGNMTAAEANGFIDHLNATQAVPYDAATANEVFKAIISLAPYNFFEAKWDGLKPLSDVVSFLASKGAKPDETPDLAEFRKVAAEKLRGADPAVLAPLGVEALPAPPKPERKFRQRP